jgi:hypothetical protein
MQAAATRRGLALLFLASALGGCDLSSHPVRGSGPAVRLDIAAPEMDLAVDRSLDLLATPRDAAGGVAVGRSITWSSSDPGLAVVSESGTVTGRGVGQVTITAAVDGTSSSLTLAVRPHPTHSLRAGENFTCALNREGAAHPVGPYVLERHLTMPDGQGSIYQGHGFHPSLFSNPVLTHGGSMKPTSAHFRVVPAIARAANP